MWLMLSTKVSALNWVQVQVWVLAMVLLMVCRVWCIVGEQERLVHSLSVHCMENILVDASKILDP